MGGLPTFIQGAHNSVMTDRAKIKLSRLREIGWSFWDPIGLREISGSDWKNGGACADEYDSYLMEAAVMLRRGDAPSTVVAYLIDTETGHIGLTPNETTASRAEATVAALSDYLASLG